MKRIVASLLTTAGLLGFAAPAFARTAVSIGTVNVRSGPGTTYGILTQLADGQTAAVLSHDGSWIKVRTANGTVGYMADWFTRDVYDDQIVYVQVNTDILNLRREPAQDNTIFAQIYQGQQFRLLEVLGNWYKIDAGSKGIGWINGSYTFKVAPPPATAPPAMPPLDQPPVAGRLGLTKQVKSLITTNIYNGRSFEYDIIAPVKQGQVLSYLDSMEGWIKVTDASGNKGWIPGDQVRLTDQGATFALQSEYRLTETDWDMLYFKVREVTAFGDGLQVHTTSSATSPVKRTLKAGEQLKLLAIPPAEYVQVMLADGTAGWVSRNYLKMVATANIPTEAVWLKASASGVMRLELGGLTAPSAVSSTSNTLTLSLPDNANRLAALQVNYQGITAMNMDRSSLTLRFDHSFRYQVISSSATGTVIEIRPQVTGVTVTHLADRDVYRLPLVGVADPSVTRIGSDVVLNLPGATVAGGVVAPAGFTLLGTSTGVTGRVTTSRPYAIKRGADYIDLVIYTTPGLVGKTIVVDPGHGGTETGAVANGLMEKDVNLAIGLKLKALLEAAGAKVVMTRIADTRCANPTELSQVPLDEQLHYDLNCRTVVANTAGADAFVSIHSNANPSTLERGTETYWSSDNLNASQSQVLGTLVQQELVAGLGLQDRRAKDDIYYVIKFTDAPAILAEVAFVTNSTDASLLKTDDFRQKAANSLLRGLQRFYQ